MNFAQAIDELITGIIQTYHFQLFKESRCGKIYISPNLQYITPKTNNISLVITKTTRKSNTTFNIAVYPEIYTNLKVKKNNYIIQVNYYGDINGDRPCNIVPKLIINNFKSRIDNYLELSDDAVKFKNMLKEDYAQN